MSAEHATHIATRKQILSSHDTMAELARSCGVDVSALELQAKQLSMLSQVPLEDAMDAISVMLHKRVARQDDAPITPRFG